MEAVLIFGFAMLGLAVYLWFRAYAIRAREPIAQIPPDSEKLFQELNALHKWLDEYYALPPEQQRAKWQEAQRRLFDASQRLLAADPLIDANGSRSAATAPNQSSTRPEPRFTDKELAPLLGGNIDAALMARMDTEVQELARAYSLEFTLVAQQELSKALTRTIIALLGLVIVGILLEATFIGPAFLFAYSEEYRLTALIAFLPLAWLAWRGLRTVGIERRLAVRLPTRWLRRYVMVPVCILLATFMLLLAPLGWIALAGWAFGTQDNELYGTLLNTTDYSERRCDYRGTLEVGGLTGVVCLRDRIAGLPPMTGDRVRMRGRKSTLGIYVDKLEAVHR